MRGSKAIKYSVRTLAGGAIAAALVTGISATGPDLMPGGVWTDELPAAEAAAPAAPAVAVPAEWSIDPANEETWPAVYTFEEAAEQCETLSQGEQQLSDCINSAIISWCEFVPFQPGDPHYREDIDGPCLAEEQRLEQVAKDMAELEEPAEAPEPEPVVQVTTPADPEEDEAGFDCRVHGNELCSAVIEGDRYLIQFEGGEPSSIWLK